MVATKTDIRQYRYILKEIKDLEKRMKSIQKQLDKLETSGSVIDTVSGGYGGTQIFKIEGIPEGIYSKKKSSLLFQKMRHRENLDRLSEIEKSVCSFIDGIPDSEDRTIFRMYYEDGFSQQQISMQMSVDQSTVSRILNKYLKQLA